MTAAATIDRHGVGGNAPPPIETHRLHIEDLMHEAQVFLDGEPVADQGQADAVGKLLIMLREARKGADQQRAVEKKPHDDAGKAVQEAWKPLLTRCDLAVDTAKRALAPFLAAEEARQRAEAAAARAEADRQAEEARAALRATDVTDLAQREAAEESLKEAGRADRAATKLEKGRAQVQTGGRAVGLRSLWRAEITDRRAALQHYLRIMPGEFEALIQRLADAEARTGPRSAPGIQFTEERIPV